MKPSTRYARTLAATTVTTVAGVSLGIALQQAAGLPFPPALAWEAWPDWAVLTAAVYACTSVCYGAVERVFGVRVTDVAHPG